MKATLSVAIITFNEEDRIGECLASVVSIADEIVVLDSFSTDQTEAICRRFPNVRFERHPFDGHIQQKNRALLFCNSDWILCLDADERLSPELLNAIRQFLVAPPSGVVGVKFPRLTFHSGAFIRHGGWYPNARYRLIRRGHGKWVGENPHDYLDIDGKGTSLSGDLLHYSFDDLADQVETINQFSSIVAWTRAKAGNRFRCWRLITVPVWKWFEIYVVKRGFLDGMRGFFIATTSSYSAFLKEAKLYELTVIKLRKPSNLGNRYEELP